MNTEQTDQQTINISQEKLLAFVRTMIGGISEDENDKHLFRLGRLNSVNLVTLEKAYRNPWFWLFHDTVPERWRTKKRFKLPPIPEVWLPISVPPRFAFLVSLAQTVISRAELMQEIDDATRHEGEQHGIINIEGYLSEFVDECGTAVPRSTPPKPPRRRWWIDGEELNGIELMVMATQFEQAAKETFSLDLRQNFADASAKLVEAGWSKMQ